MEKTECFVNYYSFKAYKTRHDQGINPKNSSWTTQIDICAACLTDTEIASTAQKLPVSLTIGNSGVFVNNVN